VRSKTPIVVGLICSARLVFVTTLLSLSGTLTDLSAQAEGGGRAVLITGASTGIGLFMTELLAENGYFVYAGARSADDLKRLDAMDNVKSVRLDVTDQGEIDAAVDLIKSEGRGLYGLVNNAGVAVVGPLIEMPDEDMDFQLDVNLMGPFRVTKAFADLIIESEGRIMTTGSISGILSSGFLGAYSISKHGIEAYTDALAAEMADFGVAVSVVEPGNYKSRIVASMKSRMEDAGYTAENSRFDSMLERFSGPDDRSQYKDPDDVALAALHFMSSDTPKQRYLVVPTQDEAEITIRQIMLEMVQLNEEHEFSYDRDELIQMLDELMAGGE